MTPGWGTRIPHWLVWGGVLVVGVLVGVMAFHALTPVVEPDADRFGGGEAREVGSIHHETPNHVHGIGYDETGDRLFVATHYGLFRLDNASAGTDRLLQVGDLRYDWMGFSLDVHDGSRMFASGHPEPGENLGVARSTDGGIWWQRVWDGPDGVHVDFHSMALSAADGDRLVGAWGGALHYTFDAGAAWESRSWPSGGACWGEPCLAWDAEEPDALWIGDDTGLHKSQDAGVSWQVVKSAAYGAVFVHPADGRLWAWNSTAAIAWSDDDGASWTPAGALPDPTGPVFQFTAGPGRADLLFAATLPGHEVYRSMDGGESWQPLPL